MRTLAIVKTIKDKYLMCYDLNCDELPVLEVGGEAPGLPEIGDEDSVSHNVSKFLKHKDSWLPLCTYFIDVEHFAEVYCPTSILFLQHLRNQYEIIKMADKMVTVNGKNRFHRVLVKRKPV